ncbi:MAG: aminotransferase class V-fold PLP-dependent enzyme [Burkholderiales bacterium]|nr:aminotransferase class V-fold PLP-dependent enzyme [Burkholderiales bacterium]
MIRATPGALRQDPAARQWLCHRCIDRYVRIAGYRYHAACCRESTPAIHSQADKRYRSTRDMDNQVVTGAAPTASAFAAIKDAVGLDVTYRVATGRTMRRIYLDSTATTLRLKLVQEVLDRFQPHYSNTHSLLHFGALISTREYQWSHEMVLRFVNADAGGYFCFFIGSGATAGFNRVARTLRAKRPERDVVITTLMEHHSNDLPHRAHFPKVVHVPPSVSGNSLGGVDLGQLERALLENSGRVNYVALTGVSNVTGIVNPIHEAARLAHRHGALIVVDAAQMAAHLPIRTSLDIPQAASLDVVVFSGHKVYAPGSPGVVVARKELFSGVPPQEVGGGMVDTVWEDRYTESEQFPDREEAGTPNIPGAIGLAAALCALRGIGMDAIAAEEEALMRHALVRLAQVPDVIVYGETDTRICRRAGAIAFNLKEMDHALTAAILNDYFNIAVRNQCFCAHPYVRELVMLSLSESADMLDNEALEKLAELHRGMVRASFGIYTTSEDVDALAEALRDIGARRDFYATQYERLPDGNYVHRDFRFDSTRVFSVRKEVGRLLSGVRERSPER